MEYRFIQYGRGDNGGGLLDVDCCPTISKSSFECNVILVEYDNESGLHQFVSDWLTSDR